MSETLLDSLGRPLRELRVSVTDRCNLRCVYCMPEDRYDAGHVFAPRSEILRFEEIVRLARIAVERLGVRKLRLTGGEPLLRRELPRLVGMLSELPGLDDLTLTTNGALLAAQAQRLKAAGLRRVTISLDALDPETFARMSGGRGSPEAVLHGIDAALHAGLSPLKLNCVVRRGVNEHAVETLASHFAGRGVVVRFIEYMDVGTVNGWSRSDVVTAEQIRERLERLGPLERLPAGPNDVAERYRYRDTHAEVGIIASVTRPFCGGCSRARLSADGKLLTCLFAAEGTDLRGPLRAGADDDALFEHIADVWRRRADRYSEQRAEQRALTPKRRLEMFAVGG